MIVQREAIRLEEGEGPMSIAEGRARLEPNMGFPRPLEVGLPRECEGWEELYPPHSLFAEDRREFEESRFWFQDSVHYPEPCYPFDIVCLDATLNGLCHASARLFAVPTSLGLEQRVLGGYMYLSPNSITDAATIAHRAELFTARGGHYYEHWHELDRQWRAKVQAEIAELDALAVPALPDVEDGALVTEGCGVGSAYALLTAYDRMINGFDRIGHYHFELVNLGYGAYLALYELCRQEFPDISDQVVAKMVSGIDVVALRPDDELRLLANRAVELGVASEVESAHGEEQLVSALEGTDAGDRWLADYRKAKHPWFCFSLGNGLYHHHRSWIDDPSFPIAMISSYVARVQAGEDIRRPQEAVLAERDRITVEYRALLPEQSREAFDRRLGLARTVFPHIEDHNFYIDHWSHTVLWNKVREFGSLLSEHAFLADTEDVFFLRHEEVRLALEELRLQWSSGGAGVPRGPAYWPPIVERRKRIYAALRRWSPPPALGATPESVTEPITIMHWGITTDRVQAWLTTSEGAEADTMKGIAGSPGIAEGAARVILDVEQLSEVQAGEVLVAAFTSTSWTPVFGRIAAAVTDAGGVMCHAAILAREYGLPAVLGIGSATKWIATGDLVRVDGDDGVVTLIGRCSDGAPDRAGASIAPARSARGARM
jgi:pyruvate, water dikinase